jgi:hypothetical protein
MNCPEERLTSSWQGAWFKLLRPRPFLDGKSRRDSPLVGLHISTNRTNPRFPLEAIDIYSWHLYGRMRFLRSLQFEDPLGTSFQVVFQMPDSGHNIPSESGTLLLSSFQVEGFRYLAREIAKVPQNMPRNAPAMTSLGKCSPRMIMQIPVAKPSSVNGIRHEGYLAQTTVATVNALVVCPDGSPWSVGVSKRAIIPRVGVWKGRGSPNASLRIVVRAIAETMATARTRELVQS